MTHHLLYWLGINWWSLSLRRAQFLRVSKTCPLCLSWCGGSFAGHFQLILTSFGRYFIPVGHFPQKSLSRNPRISFPLSPPPDHTLLPLTYDLPPLVLARYKLVKSEPYACSTFACVQNLPAVFAMVWRLIYTSCRQSLTSYGMSYFLIPHSL